MNDKIIELLFYKNNLKLFLIILEPSNEVFNTTNELFNPTNEIFRYCLNSQ